MRDSSPFRNVYAHVLLYSCHFFPIYKHLEIDTYILHHGGMYTLEQLYYDCAIRALASYRLLSADRIANHTFVSIFRVGLSGGWACGCRTGEGKITFPASSGTVAVTETSLVKLTNCCSIRQAEFPSKLSSF